MMTVMKRCGRTFELDRLRRSNECLQRAPDAFEAEIRALQEGLSHGGVCFPFVNASLL